MTHSCYPYKSQARQSTSPFHLPRQEDSPMEISLSLALFKTLTRRLLCYTCLQDQTLSAQTSENHPAAWPPLPGTLLPLPVPEYKPLNCLWPLALVWCVLMCKTWTCQRGGDGHTQKQIDSNITSCHAHWVPTGEGSQKFPSVHCLDLEHLSWTFLNLEFLFLSNLSSVNLIAHFIILLFAMASERMLASLPSSQWRCQFHSSFVATDHIGWIPSGVSVCLAPQGTCLFPKGSSPIRGQVESMIPKTVCIFSLQCMSSNSQLILLFL